MIKSAPVSLWRSETSRRVVRAVTVLAMRAVILLLAVEGVLQLGAWAVEKSGATRRVVSPGDGRPVVVFLGDSHIYGFHVGATETLPAQTEALSMVECGQGFRAVNLGVPTMPSWEVAKRAQDTLADLHPVAVVVRAGFVNWVLGPVGPPRWYQHLRLVKLTHTLRHPGGILRVRRPMRDGGTAMFEARRATPLANTPAMLQQLEGDLAAIARQGASLGARVYFLSYFDELDFPEGFTDINGTIEITARKVGAAFVDCAALGGRALAVGPREKLAYYDCHNTPLAYAMEARLLIRRFAAAGLCQCATVDDPMQYFMAHRDAARETWRPSRAQTVLRP